MASQLPEIALAFIAQGCHVIPCKPRDKQALVKSGKGTKWEVASNDEAQVRAWWATWPTANIAIGCRKSNRCVLDVDHGLSSEEEARAWIARVGLPPTFTVRTGRRPEFGLQFHFEGVLADVGEFQLDGCSGQVKSEGGYVMMPGSIHPDTGETYQVWADVPLAPIPDVVRNLRTVKRKNLNADGTMQKVPEGAGRHAALMSFAGTLRNKGFDRDAILAQLLPANDAMCEVPIADEDLEHIADSAAGYALPEPEPVALIGTGPTEPEPLKDWRERYMSEETFQNVKPPEFVIDGFLIKKSIAMLAGPVSQRKSIVALNICHALCTGGPLFNYFNVSGGHERVVYLCPEMGAATFVKRIKQIGLGKYIGKTLFVQTMSESPTTLDELNGELPGAVVIVDTITRFIEGDENKSEDMREFAKKVFRLVNAGATVVLVHHSKKGSSGSLDDGLRGSSELAAFVDSCWVTELEDPKEPYKSLSKMRNVKQRDFESDPFKLKPTPDSYYLAMDAEPAPEAALKSKAEDAARIALEKILKGSPKTGINKLRDALKAAGHGKGQKWVTRTKGEILGAGVVVSSD